MNRNGTLGATQFIWIANSFVLASFVLQPLMGQLANPFGRRIPLIWSTALFILGSGIAGGAHNPAMLFSSRTVQGIGAGGIHVLLDVVCYDLVPLREGVALAVILLCMRVHTGSYTAASKLNQIVVRCEVWLSTPSCSRLKAAPGTPADPIVAT
ncbi:hypothetical protein N8T08_004543 [Aspergillus melleus]|uniref:Uncharacterized protein n=1 Tax=Aspergillus melleus TaxID=138277 RepID=A0ACC3B4G3_9EURO|nr:hypothetical protein N8T08_004543 [Aspergillus melleus]